MRTDSGQTVIARRLHLRDFRNHEKMELQLSKGFNSLWGANAAGKTSVLEALFLCVSGRSFRALRTQDLVRHEASFFALELHFSKGDVDHTLAMSGDGKTRNLFLNGAPLSSLKDLLGVFPGVLACPGDLMLIRGAPADRRRFLDLQLSQADPAYLHSLARYTRALKQRNQQLKDQQSEGIHIWELEMARSGAYVQKSRLQLLLDLNEKVAALHAQLVGEEGTLVLRYRPSGSSLVAPEEMETALKEALISHRPREFVMGSCLVGPHRDDFTLSLEGHLAKPFASEGELRTLCLVLRLAEWQRLQERCGMHPVLFLDDVDAHLDSFRWKRLLDWLSCHPGQVCVSSPQPICPNSSLSSALFHIQQTAS